MRFISKFNKGFEFLLCVIDIYSKYEWIVPLKDTKSITIINDFQKILDQCNCKTSKICVDKGIKFCNRSMKSWLQDNDIEMYSAHNEGKSVLLKDLV